MLIVETVVRIRREHAAGKAIKAIACDHRWSRKVVRKAIRSPEAAFNYQRKVQPRPRIGPYQDRLDALLEENEGRGRRDRLRMTRIHDLLVREGFDGSYDAVRRYAAGWRLKRRRGVADAPTFIPLMFQPGEAYQFDWSHEDVEIAGKPMRVNARPFPIMISRQPVRWRSRSPAGLGMKAAQRRFADTRARKIDSRIDEILVSFAAFAGGRKVEREEARERARLEEIARQRRAEQARLAKLEQQRVEYLDRKLAQADERDRLRTFLMTLPADHILGEASASHAFIEWARQRLERMEAQLQLSTIAAEVSEMEVLRCTTTPAA